MATRNTRNTTRRTSKTAKPDHRDVDAAAQMGLKTAVTGFYAAAGAADAFYGIAKERYDALRTQLEERRQRREKQAEDMRKFVTGLPNQAKGVQTDHLLADLTARYNEMAGRGRKVVDRLVRQASDAGAQMSADAENVRDTARETVSPFVNGAQESANRARRVADGESAATATRQTSTRRQAAARRTTSKTAGTSSSATTKPAAKKASTSKSTASKSTAGKAAASKPAEHKASENKSSGTGTSN